jgi:tetraacyldisaccharide 4'-kinase
VKAPAFWWRSERSLAALALTPVAQIVGAAAARRMARAHRFQPPVPVICVGNFVVGGAGKTPTALTLARMARGRGLRPGFVASGYRGSATGVVRVDPSTTAEQAGDEALLLAAVAPTVAGRDRAAAARLLVADGDIDLIVMDDGFQNPDLAKDLSFVVVDAGAGAGLGNGLVLPAGPLRAPLAMQLHRADAIVIVGEGAAAELVIRAAARLGRPVLRADLKPTRIREWRKGPILAFAGIGRPEKFFASLAAIKAPVASRVSFPDHHRYSPADAIRLMAHADAAGLRLVTTEKDMARLTGAAGAAARLRARAEAFAVTLEFENPAAVADMIEETVRKVAQRAEAGR